MLCSDLTFNSLLWLSLSQVHRFFRVHAVFKNYSAWEEKLLIIPMPRQKHSSNDLLSLSTDERERERARHAPPFSDDEPRNPRRSSGHRVVLMLRRSRGLVQAGREQTLMRRSGVWDFYLNGILHLVPRCDHELLMTIDWIAQDHFLRRQRRALLLPPLLLLLLLLLLMMMMMMMLM